MKYFKVFIFIIISLITNMRYTQFYCSSNEGMKLRSGKIINCLENTELFHDFEKIKYDIHPERYSHYGRSCRSAFVLFEFFEKHYKLLSSQQELSNLYYSISKYLTSVILPDLKSEYNKCFCDMERKQGERECILLKEYEILNVERENHRLFIENQIEDYADYEYRKHYRLYHTNFISINFVRVRQHTFPVPKHNISQIITEMELWLKYFNRMNQSDRNDVHKML